LISKFRDKLNLNMILKSKKDNKYNLNIKTNFIIDNNTLNNNIKINDFYNGNIINPINKDYSTCQHYIHDLFTTRFIEQQ